MKIFEYETGISDDIFEKEFTVEEIYFNYLCVFKIQEHDLKIGIKFINSNEFGGIISLKKLNDNEIEKLKKRKLKT